MRINKDTKVEEVAKNTKDGLNNLCDIKNNESDNSKTTREFAKQFVEKLDKKEMCPKPEFVMTEDDVEEELEKYNRVLDSDILDAVTMGETIGYLKAEKEATTHQKFKKMGETLEIIKQEQEAKKDCRTCQNMSCTVEHYEKPVEGCLGYINHDQFNDSPVRRILAKRKNKSN